MMPCCELVPKSKLRCIAALPVRLGRVLASACRARPCAATTRLCAMATVVERLRTSASACCHVLTTCGAASIGVSIGSLTSGIPLLGAALAAAALPVPAGAGLLAEPAGAGLTPGFTAGFSVLLPAGGGPAGAAPAGRTGAFACAPAEVLKLAHRQIRQALRDRIARIDNVQFQTCKDKARSVLRAVR